MKLHPPFEIASNLRCAVRVGGAVLSLEAADVRNNRLQWAWEVELPDKTRYEGCDISTGVQHTDNAEGTLAAWGAFLAFLGACGEAVDYQDRTGRASENTHLFPPKVAEWAAQHNDAISILGLEIEETPGLLEDSDEA